MKRILAVVAVLALLAACDTQEGPPDVKVSNTAQSLVELPAVTPNTTDKVVVFVIENKSLAQIKAGAPKLWALGQQYAYASNFRAITHPSLPNYIAMMSGSTQGVKDDKFHKVKAPNVLSGSWANGRTGKVIMDGMGTDRCRQTNGGSKYVWRHNPWVPFTSERAQCEKYDFDLKYLAGDVAAGKLANVGFIVANNCNNAHDCSVATADKWHADKIKTLMSGPDWKAGRLTIVVTADEDSKKDGNLIYTAVLHPSLSRKVVTTPLSLYSLSGLLSDFGHSPRLLNAKTAPDLAAAFGLTVN